MYYKFATLVILLNLSFQAFAQDTVADPCADPMTQTEMNICAFESFEEAEKKMAEVYERAREHFLEKDMQDRFVQSHEVWRQYRDSHCEFSADQYKGGSIRPLILAACMETLTQERTWHIVNLFPEWD
jgi:uncharacterized protein YecT (DUF1311 family)